MSRPDIPCENNIYDGWQAIDATPQEASEGNSPLSMSLSLSLSKYIIGIHHEFKAKVGNRFFSFIRSRLTPKNSSIL